MADTDQDITPIESDDEELLRRGGIPAAPPVSPAPPPRIAAPGATATPSPRGLPPPTGSTEDLENRGMASRMAPRPMAAPSATAAAATPSPLAENTAADEKEIGRLRSTGSGISQLQHGSPPGGIGIAKPHPVAGGILRGLETVGDIVAPRIMARIPGTELHHEGLIGREEGKLGTDVAAQEKEAAAAKDTAQAKAADRNDALTRALLAKGYTLENDPTTGEPTLTDVPGFQREKPEPLFDKSGALIGFQTGEGLLDLNSPKLTPEMKAIAEASKPKVPQVGDAGATSWNSRILNELNVNPKTKKEKIPQEYKVLPTDNETQAKEKLQTVKDLVSGAAGQEHITISQQAAQQRRADKFYSYTDADGKVQLASGDKVPGDAEGVIPVTDVKSYIESAENTNLVQTSLNQLSKNNMAIFDDPKARATLTTALDEGQARSIGFLIAGTGGSLSLPSGSGHIIDQFLENNAVPQNLRRDVKNYIVDYYSMKDKLIALQMAMQHDRMGRGQQAVIQAMFNQLPGPSTADSDMAKRALGNLQGFLEGIKDRYPEQYGKYKKAAAGIAGTESGGTPESSGKSVSLTAARQLPINKGKSDDEIRADIIAHGHKVIE